MHIYALEFRKMVTITLYASKQKTHRCIEQSLGLLLLPLARVKALILEPTPLDRYAFQSTSALLQESFPCNLELLGP